MLRSSSGKTTLPLEDVEAVFLRHPAITCTQEAMVALAKAGSVLLCCDERSMPVSVCLPLGRGHPPVRHLQAQARASRKVQDRLWRQVVRARVESQGRLLRDVHGHDFGLLELASKVRNGDPADVESQAAAIYWPALFRRGHAKKAAPLLADNPHLSFGRSVLIAAMARAIWSAGLHPAIRLHPRAEPSAFGLAIDLSEPLRTGMEACVHYLLEQGGLKNATEPEICERILRVCNHPRLVDGEQRTLTQAAERVVASLVEVYEGRRSSLALPAA